MQLLLTGVNFIIIFIDFDFPIISTCQFVMDMRALGIQREIVGVNGNTHKPFTRRNFEHIIEILCFI
ncbi:unnamed protein product [Lathyrus oleraceus]